MKIIDNNDQDYQDKSFTVEMDGRELVGLAIMSYYFGVGNNSSFHYSCPVEVKDAIYRAHIERPNIVDASIVDQVLSRLNK